MNNQKTIELRLLKNYQILKLFIDFAKEGDKPKPAYISLILDEGLRKRNYSNSLRTQRLFCMGLQRHTNVKQKLVEHRLPLKPGKKLIKQRPRRFVPKVMAKIKAKIE